MKRRVMLLGGILAAGGAGWALIGRDGPMASEAKAAPATTTTPIVRGPLVDRRTFKGQLGYAPPSPVHYGGSGMVTWLAAAGSTVKLGGVLYKVDEQPVILLHGTVPMYRDLSEGDSGPDVTGLRRSLSALGHGTRGSRFDDGTKAAVRRWQKAVGLELTGAVRMSDVYFARDDVRVDSHAKHPGERADGVILKVTGGERVVTAEVKTATANWLQPGGKVEITVAGQADRLPATIATIVPIAAADPQPGSDSPEQRYLVTMQVNASAMVKDGAVDVSVAGKTVEDALSVPVVALLAVGDGKYAIDVVDGARNRVQVELGAFADGRVQISGDGIRAGLPVVIPA